MKHDWLVHEVQIRPELGAMMLEHPRLWLWLWLLAWWPVDGSEISLNWNRLNLRKHCFFSEYTHKSLTIFCILNKSDGTIFSMCCLSQIFSTKSSDTVFRMTPCKPLTPATRIESRISTFSWFPWHIEENFDIKKSYRRWYDGVSSSMFANRTNCN